MALLDCRPLIWEKVYDMVCMEKSTVAEKSVDVVQDMYESRLYCRCDRYVESKGAVKISFELLLVCCDDGQSGSLHRNICGP